MWYGGQEEKGTTEDEMAGWHHWLDAHVFGWTLGVGGGQGGQACCNSWGRKELDTTEQLKWTQVELRDRVWGHTVVNTYLVLCVELCPPKIHMVKS